MTEHHTHIWTGPTDGTWSCADCGDTAPTCIVERPSDEPGEGHPSLPAQAICNGCLRYEQGVLDDIADALGHWQHQPRSLVPAIRYDRDKIGGSRTENDRPTITKPTDVLDVLWDWADMWGETRGENPRGDVLTWLKRHILWAANNPDTSVWHDYRTEMRQMRHHARRVAGLLPKRLAGPCVHCGGQVVQDWATDKWQPRIDPQHPEHNGLSDVVRCTGCHITWQHHEAWMFTNRHTLRLLPNVKPDALITLEDARRIFPDVPAATWRKWRERDEQRAANGEPCRMPKRGEDVRGRPLYQLEDLTNLVEHRKADTRPGRRAG